MEKDIFVQNIKKYCALRGVKPTVACRECGVGQSFINDIERGRRPLVTKVQTLASYLGVSTSQLLGEELPGEDEKDPASTIDAGTRAELVETFSRLPPERRQRYLEMLRDLAGE